MAKYTFTGDYTTDVQLPDLTVIRVEPGETVELPFDEPGALWAGARTQAAKAAVEGAVKFASTDAATTPEENV